MFVFIECTMHVRLFVFVDEIIVLFQWPFKIRQQLLEIQIRKLSNVFVHSWNANKKVYIYWLTGHLILLYEH